MNYTPKNFIRGEVLKADDLNFVNSGIEMAESEINSLTSGSVASITSSGKTVNYYNKDGEMLGSFETQDSQRNVQDNLTSESTTDALSANQGRLLANGSARDNTKAPIAHSSTESTYGLGSTSKYGHVKTINGLTQNSHADGTALSAYQGYLLANGSAKDNSAISNITASGTTVTFTKRDGTTGTFTTQDNNTTYSAGSGLSMSGTTINHGSTITAGTVGTSSATSGTTIAVPYVTYNGTGHVTATGTHNHTISEANLMGNSAKGGLTTPVYWNGSAWTNCTAYGSASVSYATSAGSANAVAWGNVTGKPSTYTPSAHTHDYIASNNGTSTGTLTMARATFNSSFSSYNGAKMYFYNGTGGANGNLWFDGQTLSLTSDNNISQSWIRLNAATDIQCRKLNATGDVYIPLLASNLGSPSSRRYKKNIEPLTEEEAQKILEVETVTYDYKDGDGRDRKNRRGVIAEQVDEIIPSVVLYSDVDGEYIPNAVDYSAFVPYLIKMIQMQQKEIEILKEKMGE